MLRNPNKTPPVPIRRQSREAGRCEQAIWRPVNRAQLNLIVRAAEKRECAAYLSGDPRMGVGRLAVAVLRELAAMVHRSSGRLDPSYATLAQRMGRSRSAIAEALRRLKEAGFLTWLRRVDRAPEGSDQRWKQTSNAFALAMPPAVRVWLGAWGVLPRAPEDDEDRRRDHVRLVEAWEREAARIDVEEHNPRLAAALARLGADRCETVA